MPTVRERRASGVAHRPPLSSRSPGSAPPHRTSWTPASRKTCRRTQRTALWEHSAGHAPAREAQCPCGPRPAHLLPARGPAARPCQTPGGGSAQWLATPLERGERTAREYPVRRAGPRSLSCPSPPPAVHLAAGAVVSRGTRLWRHAANRAGPTARGRTQACVSTGASPRALGAHAPCTNAHFSACARPDVPGMPLGLGLQGTTRAPTRVARGARRTPMQPRAGARVVCDLGPRTCAACDRPRRDAMPPLGTSSAPSAPPDAGMRGWRRASRPGERVAGVRWEGRPSLASACPSCAGAPRAGQRALPRGHGARRGGQDHARGLDAERSTAPPRPPTRWAQARGLQRVDVGPKKNRCVRGDGQRCSDAGQSAAVPHAWSPPRWTTRDSGARGHKGYGHLPVKKLSAAGSCRVDDERTKTMAGAVVDSAAGLERASGKCVGPPAATADPEVRQPWASSHGDRAPCGAVVASKDVPHVGLSSACGLRTLLSTTNARGSTCSTYERGRPCQAHPRAPSSTLPASVVSSPTWLLTARQRGRGAGPKEGKVMPASGAP